jgi:hypothetical protein
LRLSAIAGRFILSVNDRPQTREVFQPFRSRWRAARLFNHGLLARDRIGLKIVAGPMSFDLGPYRHGREDHRKAGGGPGGQSTPSPRPNQPRILGKCAGISLRLLVTERRGA